MILRICSSSTQLQALTQEDAILVKQAVNLATNRVAAFKCAQDHQRCANYSIENQQQSILALKFEVEHLIISILNDPCISRVMREAGFSSTLVKTKVEQALRRKTLISTSKKWDTFCCLSNLEKQFLHVSSNEVYIKRIISSFPCKGIEESQKKRPRDEFGSSCMQRLGEAMNENTHRVFLMEDFEQVDYFTQKGIKKTIESASITLPSGESVPLKNAIVIFSSEKTSAYSENIVKGDVDKWEEKTLSFSFDLNIAMEVDAQNVHLPGDLGILELIDKQINFRTQEL
ncbi:double Clp-N motif P-loop nucleoside triphosphate hydrolase superfamily protein, putative [Medicago truncatula]|uniref:Double Clp-N motif P-loop nucleoside triphosphate hydrolase superfamily protein, putative n=1 Tax=Medicago truncatula TaxID=3880 RepID=A0A072TDE8_MEDTR|nr:double Clp-N motif P-loop nucleoside triphosphate hydrolase superfamily protein, putative [Medicago truncatula]